MSTLLLVHFSPTYRIMEKFLDIVHQGFLDIFSLFSLGMKISSASTFPFFLLVINTSTVSLVLMFYLAKGSFFVSYDALSKATDAIDLFFPILVHTTVIFINIRHQKIFNEISKTTESIDQQFKNIDHTKLKEVKASFILAFTLKFLAIHVLGLGIDAFILIT